MTMMIEPESWPDRILARFGKKRAVFIPPDTATTAYLAARREGFFRALFRPKGQKPPDGWIYWDINGKQESQRR